jgi:hypothetical protein
MEINICGQTNELACEQLINEFKRYDNDTDGFYFDRFNELLIKKEKEINQFVKLSIKICELYEDILVKAAV